jgi:hypothetical protein
MTTGEPAGVLSLKAPRSVWALGAGCESAVGRARRTNWRSALEQVTAERSRLWCDGGRSVESVSLSCGRVVGNSHNEPSAVVQET